MSAGPSFHLVFKPPERALLTLGVPRDEQVALPSERNIASRTAAEVDTGRCAAAIASRPRLERHAQLAAPAARIARDSLTSSRRIRVAPNTNDRMHVRIGVADTCHRACHAWSLRN